MTTVIEQTTDYQNRLPLLHRLEEEVLFILNKELRERSIKTHSVISRIKTLESYLGKAKRKNYDKAFKETTDLVGIRVVTLFRSDLPIIAALLRSNFDVFAEDDKIENALVTAFGYLSVHFVLKLKPSYSGPRYHGLADLSFEVQVRTLAMDSWASISHYLDYKNESDVPKELRKDFYALSGLFYVADTHFEMFYKAQQVSRKQADRRIEGEDQYENEELNLDTVSSYLTKKLGDRSHAPINDVSELVQELRSSGLSTLGQLDEILKATRQAFELYEPANPPNNKPGDRYLDIGLVRLSLAIYDDRYAKRYKDDFTKYRTMVKKLAP